MGGGVRLQHAIQDYNHTLYTHRVMFKKLKLAAQAPVFGFKGLLEV